MPVTEIKTDFGCKEFLRSNNGIVVFDFYANWCQPCKVLSKVLDEVASQAPTVKFVKINVDNVSSIASEYQVSSLPTLVILKRGVEVDRIVGLESKDKILRQLKKHM